MMSTLTIYKEFIAKAEELEKADGLLQFNYEDPDENEAARSHVFAIRKVRSALDKARKDEKAESLAYGRKVDSEAKEIAERFTALIDRHHGPLTEIEEREAARQAGLAAQLETLRALGTPTNELRTAEQLREALAELEALAGIEWAEFEVLAKPAAADGRKYLEAAIAHQAQSEMRDRELAELRAAQEARDAEEAGKAQAEHDAQQELERIEREKREAAQRERERIERDAQVARETEERLAREAAAEKANAARREKRRRENEKHVAKVRSDAAAGLVVAAEIDQELAERIIGLIASGAIANVELKI